MVFQSVVYISQHNVIGVGNARIFIAYLKVRLCTGIWVSLSLHWAAHERELVVEILSRRGKCIA